MEEIAEKKSWQVARIEKVSYSHDAMIDQIIANPRMTNAELAAYFGYSQAWVSRIKGSDAFVARLAQRRKEIVDPSLVASVDERLRGLEIQATDVLAQKLEASQSEALALKVLDISVKARNYGARQHNVAVQQTFVVAMPGKAQDAASWAEEHAPGSEAIARPVLEHTKPPLVERVEERAEELVAVGGERFVAPRPPGWEGQP